MVTDKRLIYANALKETVTTDYYEHFTRYHDTDQIALIDMVCDDIEEAPTVDAVEVVHGHWCWEGKFKACSECGSYVEWDETLGANFWKFCPYCGAKMDGGKT